MFRLPQKKKELENAKEAPSEFVPLHVRLLTEEVPVLANNLPPTCQLLFRQPDELHHFEVIVRPNEGFWKGGTFVFVVDVPTEYNLRPPMCTCKTRIWHPNIDEQGKICISILREPMASQTDGWTPARRLKEVIWAIDWLFNDTHGLLNFTDPLNCEAADMYKRDKGEFERKVRLYVERYANST